MAVSASAARRRTSRDNPLHVEHLEQRMMLAGDIGESIVFPALDLAKFQTTSASSSADNTRPDEATDGIVSNDSRWYSNTGAGPHWLEVELRAEYPIGSAQLYLGKDDSNTVASFEIQYHNGSSWQTTTSVTGNTATDLNLIFPEAIEDATRFRFYTTESIARIKEFVLLPPNGGLGHPLGTDVNLNLASQRAPIASSVDGSNHALRAVDGYVANNSRWLAENSAGPHSLEITIPSSHEIGSLHLHSGWDNNGVMETPLTSFEIEYNNGQGWLPVSEGVVSSGIMRDNLISGNTSSELVVEFGAPVPADQLRITFSEPLGRIRELVVLPANVADTGAVGYPIGTSVQYAPRDTTNFKDYHDSWYELAARSNNTALVTTDTGSSQADSSTIDDEKWFQLLYNYALDAYRIRSEDTGKTIEVANASMEEGAAIVEGDFSAAPHQLWRLESTSNGFFQIVNVWSGMVLETDVGDPPNVTQQPRDTAPNPADNQEWNPIFQDDWFKKGTGGWTGSFGTGWAYDWARNDPNPSNKDYFYVPMQHNANWPNWGTLHRRYADWNNDDRPAYVLGFNEPDRPDQANMSVSSAINLWPRLMVMDVPLISPVTAQGGEGWLANFMDQADNLGYQVEYAGAHWYSAPSADNLLNHINFVQNQANGRPVWLTEFSVVDWSGGSGNWSEETNYNFILEFLWRAESKSNLEKYAVFIFTGGSPANPWDLTNPRSNFRRGNGTLTPFGKAYSAWDGDKTIRDNETYILHNRQARHRLMNDGSTTLTQDSIRREDTSVMWYLEDAGNGNKYITSIADGKRLQAAFEGRFLNYAPSGTIGRDVEWTIQQDQYGWHNIIHSATGQYLRLHRENNANNAPTSLTFEMVSAGDAANLSSTDWWFVKPHNAIEAPNVGGPQIETAIFNAQTNQTFDFTFSDPIDTATLQTTDFVFENLDFGFSLTGTDLFLLNVTDTSATIRFRDLPLFDGNWQLTIDAESIADASGAGNATFDMSFQVLSGDANGDGSVDSADYGVWLGTLGSTADLRANFAQLGSSEGVIDIADYAVWKANFGATLAPPLAAAVATQSIEPEDFHVPDLNTGAAYVPDQPLLEDVVDFLVAKHTATGSSEPITVTVAFPMGDNELAKRPQLPEQRGKPNNFTNSDRALELALIALIEGDADRKQSVATDFVAVPEADKEEVIDLFAKIGDEGDLLHL